MTITRSSHFLKRILATTSVMLAFMAMAAPGEAASFSEFLKNSKQTCFARHYDKAHLAQHPHQRLTSFSLGPNHTDSVTEPGVFEVDFAFTLKGDREKYGSVASCHKTTGGVECWVECDGGSFTMRTEGPNLLLNIARMEVEGEKDFTPDLAVGGDDRVVLLKPAPDSACTED